MATSKKFADIKDLVANPQDAFKADEFKRVMYNKPPESWLKPHPMATVKDDTGKTVAAKYLPIDKVEFLLDNYFPKWKVEVLDTKLILNSIVVTIRLHYFHPLLDEWLFHDGCGAKSVQVSSGGNVSNMSEVKDAGVQMAFPSAKSYAIKDACDHIGEIFGRNVNRKGSTEFSGQYDKPENLQSAKKEEKQGERILALIELAKTPDELQKLFQHCKSREASEAYDARMKQIRR